jgi:hypothetical protein
MPYRFDATLKEIVSPCPEDFAPVFHVPRALPAQPLNVDLSTISAATDVAFGFGAPLQEVVDLNFQSGPDPLVPARLHLYNAAFHLRYQVPVRSVLYPAAAQGGCRRPDRKAGLHVWRQAGRI